MKFLNSRYVKMNKLLLTCSGLWPYNNTWLVILQRIFLFLSILSGPVVQFLCFATKEFSMDLCLEVLAFAIVGVLFVIEYMIFLTKIDSLRELFEKVEDIWKTITSKSEIAIVLHYAEKSLIVTTCLTGVAISLASMIALTGLSSKILDVIIPLNVSRARFIPVRVEYFVDPQKYFYAILMHVCWITLVAPGSFVAVETTFLMFLLQACSFYKIVCHRIQLATDDIKLGMPDDLKDAVVRVRLISAMELYTTALKFCDYLSSSFAMLYFTGLSLAIASLSINLYGFYVVLSLATGRGKLAFSIVVLIAHFSYIFYGNYAGQEVINQSSEIFTKTYNTTWYAAPVAVRKLFLGLLQRSIKGYTLMLGGVFVPSLEGFTTVTSMSLSYFMFLHSTQ